MNESGCEEVRDGVYEVDVVQAAKRACEPDDPRLAHAAAVAILAHMREQIDQLRMVQKETAKQVKELNDLLDEQTDANIASSKIIVAVKRLCFKHSGDRGIKTDFQAAVVELVM